ERGFDLRVASISAPDRDLPEMTPEEREEAAATFYVKRVGVAGVVAAVARRPLASARALRMALGLAGPAPRRVAAYAGYGAEAVVLADWMAREGLAHFHTHFSSTVGLIAARAFGLAMSMTLHGPAEFDEPHAFHLREKIEAAEFVCGISNYGRS